MKKLPIGKIMAIVLLFSSSIAQTDREMVKLNEISKSVGAEVTFLQDAPVIDGFLDKNLESLPRRFFALAHKRNNDPLPPMSFRMAYGVNFFYLYIEGEADHLTYRDRAWLNGDGFVMVIATPNPNEEQADEFYELACAAVNKPELEWTRCIFKGINLSRTWVRTSSDIKHEFREGKGRISFELFLPWKDIRPFHPLISDAIGFNLSFTKALESSGDEETAIYQVVDDDMWPVKKAKLCTAQVSKTGSHK